ncbi:hypothetical protein BVX99_01460 [bacterium F16]|nr:hypothetical protein BVX99_01460 [bacterium F16]
MTTMLKRRLKMAKSKKLKRSSRMAKAVGMNKSFFCDSEKVIKPNFSSNPQKVIKRVFRTVQYTPMLDQNVSFTNVTAGTTYYYNQDERQSVKNLTDSSGIIAQSYDYTAYGDKIDSLTSGSVTQRYTYTGRELNDVSGDYYFRYRMYGAGIGGFLSRDPYLNGYIDGQSMYSGYFARRLALDPMGQYTVSKDCCCKLSAYQKSFEGSIVNLKRMFIEYKKGESWEDYGLGIYADGGGGRSERYRNSPYCVRQAADEIEDWRLVVGHALQLILIGGVGYYSPWQWLNPNTDANIQFWLTRITIEAARSKYMVEKLNKIESECKQNKSYDRWMKCCK